MSSFRHNLKNKIKSVSVEKVLQLSDFEKKIIMRQILIQKFYNASDFEFKKLPRVSFWIAIFSKC